MKKVGDKILGNGEVHTITKVGRKYYHVTRDSDGQRSVMLIVRELLHADGQLYVP